MSFWEGWVCISFGGFVVAELSRRSKEAIARVISATTVPIELFDIVSDVDVEVCGNPP